jgi:hypothetical protein
LEAYSWNPFIDISANDLVAFAVTSSAVANRPFRTLLVAEKGKIGGNKFGEYGGSSKAVTLCLARYFSTTNGRRAGAL